MSQFIRTPVFNPFICRWQRLVLGFLTSVLLLGLTRDASSCPAYLFGQELLPFEPSLRSQVRLYALRSSKAADWQRLPLQIDPVDENGRLIFYSNEAWRSEGFKELDRLTLRVEGFGRAKKSTDQLPCKASRSWQIKNLVKLDRYGYLVLCKDLPTIEEKLFSQELHYDKDQDRIAGQRYNYFFSQKNHMLFNKIALKNPDDGSYRDLALDSELLIRSDFKRFFTMSFDSNQIESYLEEYRIGEVGVVAKLSFYLKVLFLKLKLALATDVAFFSDSGHIPMQIHAPYEARSHLNPKSAIIYSWRLSEGVKQEVTEQKIAAIDPQLIRQGYKILGDKTKASCGIDSCFYRYNAEVERERLTMDFDIPKDLALNGFYPQYVEDIGSHAKEMGWKDYENLKQKRSGLYFETSGLNAGDHEWDFWLRLGEKEISSHKCPHPIQIMR